MVVWNVVRKILIPKRITKDSHYLYKIKTEFTKIYKNFQRRFDKRLLRIDDNQIGSMKKIS